MTKRKGLFFAILILIILSTALTLIDEYPFHGTAYELGRSSGIFFKHILKNFLFLCFIYYLIQQKKNKKQ